MEIQLIIGPMFSGKTTELLRYAKIAKSISLKVLVVNHAFDTRCKSEIQTHDGVQLNAIKSKTLNDIDPSQYDVVCIDEGQFFNDLKDFIIKNERCNTKLYISALDGDFARNPFGKILDIIPLVQNVKKLKAMCTICCNGVKASFTKRKSNSTEVISVGASGEYMAVCREHYLN